MKSLTNNKIVALAILALVFGFTTAWAMPEETDEDSGQEIRIERRVHCEGDDCAEHHGAGHKAIFIDTDGNQQVLGGDHVWVGADGAQHMKMMMHGGQKGGFLGVGLTDLTAELRTHFGVPESAGVMVSKIVADSPAARAGLQVGDIITLVDADEVSSASALAHNIGGHEGGSDVTLEIWRDGKAQKLTATLDEHEVNRMARMPRIHAMHGGDGGQRVKRIQIDCDSEGADCGAGSYDCGDAEECEVRVECTEGGCTCTVNGAAVDCAEIPGVPHQ